MLKVTVHVEPVSAPVLPAPTGIKQSSAPSSRAAAGGPHRTNVIPELGNLCGDSDSRLLKRIRRVRRSICNKLHLKNFKRKGKKEDDDHSTSQLVKAWLDKVSRVTPRVEYVRINDDSKHNQKNFDEVLTVCVREGKIFQEDPTGEYHRVVPNLLVPVIRTPAYQARVMIGTCWSAFCTCSEEFPKARVNLTNGESRASSTRPVVDAALLHSAPFQP